MCQDANGAVHRRELAGWIGITSLMLMVPVGGFEVKTKHVLLQPVSEIPNKNAASRRNVETWL
jgi:hypothetical protein